MDATIAHIMESWPLQLALHSASGPLHVALDENAQITRRGVTVTVQELRPGQHVEVTLRSVAGRTTATEVVIQG